MALMQWIKGKSKQLKWWVEKIEDKAAGLLENLSERYAWIGVLTEAIRNFFRHDMTLHAGNFAYSAFLAIFPLALLITYIIGMVFSYNPEVMQKAVDALKNAMPDMPTTIGDAAEAMVRFRSVVGVLGLLALIWTIGKIAYAIQTGFEQIWETQRRSFVRKKLLSLGIMLLLLVVGILGLFVTYASSQLFSWIDEHTGLFFSTLAVILGAILSPLASTLIFSVLYRKIPLRKPGWRAVIWGALTAALLLDIAEYGLSVYFTKISKSQALYGTLGVAIGVVIWLYVVGILIFLGAEIVRSLQDRWGDAETGGEPSSGVQLPLTKVPHSQPARE
jgi:membrane protein